MSSTQSLPPRADSIRVLAGFSAEEAAAILDHARPTRVPEGVTVFREGEPGTYMCIVVSGVVGIYTQGKYIAKLRAGDAFGEISALSARPRSATAMANTDVELLSLGEDEIRHILEGPSAVQFLLNVVDALGERLDTGNTWIAADIEELRSRTV